MSRRGFTLIEFAIASAISVVVLAGLSMVYFMTLNYFRSVLAETLQPTTGRALRDRIYFRLAGVVDGVDVVPTGMGLLSYSEGQIASFQLSKVRSGSQPASLGYVHMPAELKFETGWEALYDMVRQSTVTNALSFCPRGVLQGGTTNRCEIPLYLTPFGKSQPMATSNGTSFDDKGESAPKTRPGVKGAVL